MEWSGSGWSEMEWWMEWSGWMDGWSGVEGVSEWMDGWMDDGVDGWMNE